MPRFQGRVKGRLLHWREGSGRASSSCGRVAPEVGRHWRWRQGGPGGRGGSVLAGAAGAASSCWRRESGLRSGRRGCGHGDGCVDKWESLDAVAGSRRTALGSSVVDVEGWQHWGAGALGGGGFGGRMVAEITLSYVCGSRCRSPPPLLRGGPRHGRRWPP
jgi:hypothetical protein